MKWRGIEWQHLHNKDFKLKGEKLQNLNWMWQELRVWLSQKYHFHYKKSRGKLGEKALRSKWVKKSLQKWEKQEGCKKRKKSSISSESCVTGQYVWRSENCKSQDKLELAKDIKTNTEKFLSYIIKNRSRKEIKYNLKHGPKTWINILP